MTTISSWYGRLGNNIQQLSNAIYFCKKNECHFSSPDHLQIKKINLKFGNNIANTGIYYYFNEEEERKKDFDVNVDELNKERKKICEKYIYPNFKFICDKEYDEDTVIVHIRSGDVFSDNPHPNFVPNPLSYYLDIIEEYKKVIVVTEDKRNPIIAKLEDIDKVSIQISSVEEDFSTLLAAKNLVSSGYGTFAFAAALCSKKIKNFYYSNIIGQECLNGTMLEHHNIKTHLKNINLENYIQFGNWKNTKEQNMLLLEYK